TVYGGFSGIVGISSGTFAGMDASTFQGEAITGTFSFDPANFHPFFGDNITQESYSGHPLFVSLTIHRQILANTGPDSSIGVKINANGTGVNGFQLTSGNTDPQLPDINFAVFNSDGPGGLQFLTNVNDLNTVSFVAVGQQSFGVISSNDYN